MYSIQRPVRDDGSPIVGPDGRPIIIPHFQVPSWIVFNDAVDARALGAYAFLQVFVDQSEGELSSSITAADLADRFGVSEETVMRSANRRNPAGLVPRLAQAQALVVGPNSIKTRDCEACGTLQQQPCAPSCTSRKGKRRIKPRFELATHPPEGFLYSGPMDRWEYYRSERIAKRLRQEGPDSTVPREARREVVPFVQVLAWPALDPDIGLVELGAYVFLAAHTSLAEGSMSTGEDLFRNAISRRFDWSDNHVSKVTSALERRRLISKAGLVRGHEHRYGHTGEPTSYVVRVMPPAGMMHPRPIRVSEYRNADLISQRQEAVSAGSLSFSRVPSDLRIVDNSRHPQKSTRGNEGLWTNPGGAVDEFSIDLNTHPTTHPTTHPSPSVGDQVQGGGAERLSDGEPGVSKGSEHKTGTPSASPSVPDRFLEWVQQSIPVGICSQGRQDHARLAARLRSLSEAGFTDRELRDAFVGVERVQRPYPVMVDRLRSVNRLREHLTLLERIRQEEAEAHRPRSETAGRCARHDVEYDAALSTPALPFCHLCEAPADAAEIRKPFRSKDPAGASEKAGQPQGLASLLDEVLPERLPEHCGRCNEEGRFVIYLDAKDQLVKAPCPRCG